MNDRNTNELLRRYRDTTHFWEFQPQTLTGVFFVLCYRNYFIFVIYSETTTINTICKLARGRLSDANSQNAVYIIIIFV